MLRYLVEDGETTGAVLGVMEADGTTRLVSYGSAGPNAGSPGPHSVFEIGSVGKTLTATLLVAMVDQGEVALQDPVGDYLPEHVRVPSRGGREITLLDLVTHTSGLPRLADNHRPGNSDDPYADFGIESMYDFLANHQLRRAPGERYEYSNVGYGLLGHALARAGGMTFEELLRERVLTPLGMERTGIGHQRDLEAMVRGHSRSEVVPFWSGTDAMQGAGAALHSTAEDLLKYLEANVGAPRSNLERAMREAQAIQIPVDRSGVGRGFGWEIFVRRGEPPAVGHGGGTAGFQAQVVFMPERGIGTVLLTNDGTFHDNIGMALLYPDPPPPQWDPVIEVDREVLARYVGEYAQRGARNRYVRLEHEGYLTYQPEGQVRARLYATSDTTFYLLRGAWSFTFREGTDDEGMTMIMRMDERRPNADGDEQIAWKVRDDPPPPAVVAGNAASARGRGLGRWALLGILMALIVIATGRTLWTRRG
jgi:serine-type D-Ala-D-Ala carboxypeptidase/endopeptidase